MNVKRTLSIVITVATLLGAARVGAVQVPSDTNKVIRKLEFGKPIEREMATGDIHSYEVTLITGQFLRAVVDQRGIDVLVTVLDPDGKKLAEFDSPNGGEGPEPVAFEAKSPGAYRLEIKPLGKAGRYEVKIEEVLSAEEYAVRLAAERAQLDAAKTWLVSNAIPLRTVEAGNGFADMQPLKKLIGEAHLVSLGEATHGTREFFQLKHRMLEFLVSEMGFTIFGIEAMMPEAFDINEYVLTGIGDPVKALAGLSFWAWDTEEVLGMIRWMRHYNEDPRHTNKLKFYGFDMSYAPRAVRVTLDYLRRVDPEQASASEKRLRMLANPFTALTFWNLQKERREDVGAFVDTLLRGFDERKQDYIKRSSATEWVLARQHANIVSQNLKMQITPNIRDSAMAENIRWILEYEGKDSKMVAWAHNGHVATRFGDNGSMGMHLRKMFGADMVIFGFAFNQGSFQAVEMPFPSAKGLHPFTVGPAPEGSLDATLAAAGLSLATIDLHTLPKVGPVAEWFSSPHATRGIGTVYSDQISFFLPEVLSTRYNALFFVEKTTSARPVEGGQRPPMRRLTAPTNLDFESGEVGILPVDWEAPPGIASMNFRVVTSPDNPRSGKRCAVISSLPGKHYGETFGSLQQTLDATAYHGKKLKLRAAVRLEAKGEGGQAYLWLRVSKQGFGPQSLVSYENMADRPITNKEWSVFQITGEVSADAKIISYGLAFVGEGRAWLDSVTIEASDK